MTQKHKSSYRVYYEDTDAGGIMYHGNYINFCERGRSDMLRELGMSASQVVEDLQVFFVVRHLDAEYFAMAKLDDLLSVNTHVLKMKNTSFIMYQEVKQEVTGDNQNEASISPTSSPIFSMNVTIVCLDMSGKPVRIPDKLRQKFVDYLEES